jgi:hypothetical protein
LERAIIGDTADGRRLIHQEVKRCAEIEESWPSILQILRGKATVDGSAQRFAPASALRPNDATFERLKRDT